MKQLVGDHISTERSSSEKETMKNDTPQNSTKGVQILLGDPKKAIFKLALPMIIAMSVNTIYNLVDALWVSGLEGGLKAVGFFFPFLFMAMAIAVGIGTGGGAAISRRIGAKDKTGADNVAGHNGNNIYYSFCNFYT
jgi:Na+-driven multidrug efflux pump